MRVNTYDATPLLDEVIRVVKAPRFTGRIFDFKGGGSKYKWYELALDEFAIGESPWDADERGYRRATAAELLSAFPTGGFIPTP